MITQHSHLFPLPHPLRQRHVALAQSRRVFPFDRGGRTSKQRLHWLAAGRHLHLAEALERHPEAFQGETGRLLRRRLRSLRRWGRVRTAVLALLYFGILATVGTWLFRYLPHSDAAREAIDQMTALASTLTGLLTLLALFFTRLMGQLEVDIVAILILERE